MLRRDAATCRCRRRRTIATLGPDDAVDLPSDDTVAALTETPDAAAAGPRPRNRPANLAPARPKPAAVAAPKPAEAKPAVAAKAAAASPRRPRSPSAAPAPAASGVRPGTRLVQLGAFDSEEITSGPGRSSSRKNPDLLSSKNLYVERTTANARVFYRLRVAGFSNSEETRQMCEALRSRGVDCIPVTLQ